MSDERPDPDALLAALKRDDARARRGRLKVFFGMCPGVGKTYAMLRAAQQELHDGRDVIIGVVETHGRAETEALLSGLPAMPKKAIEHRGIMLSEFDLEGVLTRKPQLILVDELAHTNAPNSRHPKRYQDVVELLEAGIDVYTTVNVQHLESRADAVRQITGVTIHETVPDSVLDLADETELIDITSQALLERLHEGKVYLGNRAATAAENFFKESNLNALRELALRYTAERVDRQLRGMRSGISRVVWRSGERLLVAIGASPFSTQLVRWTRRLAGAQGAPWIAVYVESSARLRPEAQTLLDKNLALARELGAELVLTHGDDVAAALVRVALEHNATQIVIGKPRGNRWLEWLRGGNLVDRLIRLGGNIDVYVVPSEGHGRKARWLDLEPPPQSDLSEYGVAAGLVAAVTVFGLVLPAQYYLAAGLVFLLGVVGLSLKVGRWPVLMAGILSALIWDYLFIPPRFTYEISKVEDATLFVTYFVVALVTGQLTARVRAQALHERHREQRATALFQLTRVLAEARTLDDAVFAALRQIDELFQAKTTLLLPPDVGEELFPHFAGSFALDDKEKSVATWTFQNRKPAGRFTDTLPASKGFYLPLVREDRAIGVLGIVVSRETALTLAQRDLLEAFSRPLAMIIEREDLRAAREREKLLAESEKLHRALLDSVSHELRTPLAVITGAIENLADVPDEALRRSLLDEARIAARRLNRLVGNLLDQTRLESGALKPRMDWCDSRDLVNAAVESARDSLAGHPLEIAIADDAPPVRADFALTEQAITNLLVNASNHTPVSTPVFVTAGVERDGTRAFFTVADRGAGFPPEMKERLFKKFARGDAARAGGLGLGLSIVRGFIVAQGGDIVVGENPGGGSVFTIYLPHKEPQAAPNE
jgi:two-component system sensor histidine kinase KdpD